MRLPGYCTGCHRVRQVSVSGHALAMARGGAVQGMCSECEERERIAPLLTRGRKLLYKGKPMRVLRYDGGDRCVIEYLDAEGETLGLPIGVPICHVTVAR